MYVQSLIFALLVAEVLSDGCFHGSSIVQTLHNGPMTIEQLAKYPNERVLTATRDDKFIFSPIKYWLHANPSMEHDYLEIRTENNALTLSITPEHLMYTLANETTDHHFRKVIQARELKVGDIVVVHTLGAQLLASRVQRIVKTEKTGIYAPVTADGSIIVNNVLASSYAIFKNEYLQELFLDATFKCRHVLEYVLPRNWILPSFSGTQVEIPQVVVSMLQLAQSFWG